MTSVKRYPVYGRLVGHCSKYTLLLRCRTRRYPGYLRLSTQNRTGVCFNRGYESCHESSLKFSSADAIGSCKFISSARMRGSCARRDFHLHTPWDLASLFQLRGCADLASLFHLRGCHRILQVHFICADARILCTTGQPPTLMSSPAKAFGLRPAARLRGSRADHETTIVSPNVSKPKPACVLEFTHTIVRHMRTSGTCADG